MSLLDNIENTMNSFDEILLLNSRDQIIDNLWIGMQPKDPHEGIEDFKYVICCNGAPYYNIKLWQTVIVAPFDDSASLPPDQFLHDLGKLALEFSSKGKTLVHCTAGINRSATVVALALMKSGYSSTDAIKLVREKRNQCLISNTAFEQWLHKQST
jgi:protein tyrosine phosphatase